MSKPRDLHLGYSAEERATSPYAAFFRPDLAPLNEHVREALLTGAVAPEFLPPIGQASALQADGYTPVETGFTLTPDGAGRVAVLTPMPGVSAAMWDWWFAWHGSEAQRYKLWHPRAHLHAAWADGRTDLNHYVGRTSHVVEYIGSTCIPLAIRFIPPSTLGFAEKRLAASGATAICARASLKGAPVDTGWLVHHVRPVAGGAEMRSRFWIAGQNIGARPGNLAGAIVGWAARGQVKPTATQAAELLVHCAQEMSHLAAILPALHAQFARP